MTFLETQTSETQGGLPTSAVLLGEVHAELVQHISCAERGRSGNPKEGCEQRNRRGHARTNAKAHSSTLKSLN